MTRTLWLTLVCCAVLSVETRAYALQDYAMEIRDELELADQPSCVFCHARNERGLATDTPFGDALKARGFSRRLGLPALRSALRSLDDLNIDSDGDSVGDVDELRAGANPNDETDAGLPPSDSCSVGRFQRSQPFSAILWMIALVLGKRRGSIGSRYRRT